MKSVTLLLVAAASFGCRSTTSSDAEMEFRSLARGYQSGISETGVRVVRDEGEWRSLWERHASLVMPRPDAPSVDFTRDMVVYVSIGQRPTYGYSVEIVRIAPVDEADFRVEIVEKKPAPDAITSQIVTQPYHMVVTAKRAGDAVLVTR